MFWRSMTLGGVAWLALSTAVCSNGQEQTTESSNSSEQAGEKQTADDKESVEIPLSEIWAYNMPGTRDVQDLEPEVKAAIERLKTLPREEMEKQFRRLLEDSLVWQIRKPLHQRSKQAVSGFAVSSPEPELLQAVRDVLTGKEKRTDSFAAGSDITVVFFSRLSGTLVHIDHVERRGNTVEIQYRVVPHLDLYLSEHFALIPLGKLPSGFYQVKVVQGPMEQKYLDYGYKQGTPAQAAKFVSQSFTFEVQK